MGKCLITKLNGSTNNSDLLRIAEMRIKFHKVSNPTATTQCLEINALRDTKLEIIGDGYFTDSSLSQNKGKNLTIAANVNTGVYVSNNDVEVAVLDKYAITALKVKSGYKGGMSFNIDCLKYSTSINYIFLRSTNISGDISGLKNLTALTYFDITDTQVSGDISGLKNLTNLSILGGNNTQISGDIANLKNLTALTSLNMSDTQVSGDIANLKNLTALTRIEFKNVTGLTGDMGTLPDSILFFTGGNGNFTWTTSSRTYILATEKIKCDKIDDMLNDMATKTAKFAGEQAWYKTISLIGTRTSASDAAVATLQKKGYTVSITPA